MQTFLGGTLIAISIPKLCCLLPLLIVLSPVLLESIKNMGIGLTIGNLDTLCSTASLPAMLDFPLIYLLVLVSTGVALMITGLFHCRQNAQL